MRIGIREQLAGLVLLCALVPLAILAITTWVNNHNFVSVLCLFLIPLICCSFIYVYIY